MQTIGHKAPEDWRNLPIPAGGSENSTVGYHSILFDVAHELRTDPLIECDGAGLMCRPFYIQGDGLNYPYEQPFSSALGEVFLRKQVVQLLLKVNEVLANYAVELCLLDGYRRIETQREIWEFYCTRARAQNPEWNELKVAEFAARFASDPRQFDTDDFRTWPVHCTGGAIDLTLAARASRELIYMGGIFDDPSEVSYTSYYEETGSRGNSASDEMALRYRRLLYHAMCSQGFKNYPAEWWHFDWGTQMWAQRRTIEGTPTRAIYGYLKR